MLIHGRLILTANDLMLDEVRSLLQKSLRRKDIELITLSTQELLDHGKDQLPWKSITTFMFEDHCLSDASALESLMRCYKNKDKKGAIRLLASCYTCRVAACLPVVSLDDEYNPKFITELDNDKYDRGQKTNLDKYSGLLARQKGQLNFPLIFMYLREAWMKKDEKKLITCLKLVSMMHDVEKATLTPRGEASLIHEVKKPNVGHLVLSLLYKNTADAYLKRYLHACFQIMTTPEANVRLVLFGTAAHVILADKVKAIENLVSLPWDSSKRLTKIPAWAVDKHTFRGKFGKGVSHLVGKRGRKTAYEKNIELFEEFYGERPKSDLKEFFNSACVCNNESLTENPYWERTVQIYFEQAKSKQKTVRMTADYYKDLKTKLKELFIQSAIAEAKSRDGKDSSKTGGASDESKSTLVKGSASLKRAASTSNTEEISAKRKKLDKVNLEKRDKASDKSSKTTSEQYPFSSLNLRGPLLQLPTGSGKVYTAVDLGTNKVWKGPYRGNRLNLALFLHQSMRVLADPHTFPVDKQEPYLVFPLFKGNNASLKVEKRGFYDAISKRSYADGLFINRDELDLIQLHRLSASQILSLSPTIWAHFAYRFALNVGDSGLYNAIADSDLTYVRGIDMEEMRGSVKGQGFLNLIFTKPPNKHVRAAILENSKKNKSKLLLLLQREDKSAEVAALAQQYQVDFDESQFCKRMKQVATALQKLE